MVVLCGWRIQRARVTPGGGEGNRNKMQKRTFIIIVAAIMLVLAGLACGESEPESPAPTAPPTLAATLEPTPTPEPTEPTDTPEPSPMPTVDTSNCTLGATFQADVTIPDNTKVESGQPFTKTWRVRNTGTCTWGPGYSLAIVDGEQMGGSNVLDIPTTDTGKEAEISVILIAPTEEGTYRGNWQMCVSGRECFGQEVYVQIVSHDPRAPATPDATEPTATPDVAGATVWLEYEGQRVGVREVSWNYRLGIWRPEDGNVFLSVYIVGTNTGKNEETFNPLDFAVVDGSGRVNGTSWLAEKEPEFDLCTAKPGGTCEGWWTTQIVDRPKARENLIFQWEPNWLTQDYEVPLVTEGRAVPLTPVPRLGSAPLDCPQILAAKQQMTDVQWDAYKKKLKAQRIKDWSGLIREVGDKRFLFGGYPISIDVISDCGIYYVVEDKKEALQFSKGQKVTISGQIESVSEFLGSITIYMVDETVEIE